MWGWGGEEELKGAERNSTGISRDLLAWAGI